MKQSEITFREEVTDNDPENVRQIVLSTGFFHDYEIDVAVDLVKDTLILGSEEGYKFVFAEINGKTVGYCCFGLIPCTRASYDLYWIAVHNDYRGKGVGKQLLAKTEEAVVKANGIGLYIETSSKEIYHPTRQFYIDAGYATEVVIKDFYDIGDGKFLFSKRFTNNQ
jgi:D-alanine-D-alanine ligase